MTGPIRIAQVASAWRRWLFAGAVSLLLVFSHGAWPQTVVRVTRSDGAMVLPKGPKIRLGSQAAAGRGLVDVQPNRICCPDQKADPPPVCITERRVRLGASRKDIVARYGPPSTKSTRDVLLYPGIEFWMSKDQLIKMCAVRG